MMDQDSWKEVNRIFHEALEVSSGERRQFVLHASGGDPSIRAEVERLLQADHDAGSYLVSPLVAPDISSTDTDPVKPGDELCGRFRVLRAIAEGGMGRVFEAFDSELGTSVALKMIRPEIANDPQALTRFRQEVRFARQISHPNVCRTFDIERDIVLGNEGRGGAHGVVFLTMEFLPGETLASRISLTGALPLDLTLQIARQIASAIDAAHALKIVHRDLKPGNIMLISSENPNSSQEARAVITDFGLARLERLTLEAVPSGNSQAHAWPVGTLAYMSPEQLRNHSVDSATDIYSFGLILFEMVTGRRAFAAETLLEGISQRIAGNLSALTQDLERLPAEWREAIKCCLRTEPSERPRSAAEAVEILGGSHAPSLLRKRSQQGHSTKALWLIAPLLILTLLWASFRPPSRVHVSSYKQLTHDGRMKFVAGTDGKWLYVTSGPTGGPVSLSRVSVEGGELETIPIRIPATSLLDWDVSEDGSKALVGIDRAGTGSLMSLWSVPINGGSLARLATGSHLSGAFTPSGDAVIYFNGEGDIYQVRSDGTGARKIASLGPGVSDVRMSPDDKAIRVFKNGMLLEMASNGSGLHKLLPDWHEPGVLACGRWSSDGNIYTFWQVDPWGSNQLWALDERRRLFRRPSNQAIQLTNGPIDWNRPVPGKDGTEVYAMGNSWRGELSRIDPGSKQLQPFLGGISAEHVAFSEDGKFVTYTEYPIRFLWKANRDGTNPVQLTNEPLNSVANPHWSPDGKQILFMNASFNSTVVAYTVAAAGGPPQRLLPDDKEDEADPNWSADGKRVVLAGGDSTNAKKQYIRILDLAVHQISKIKDSTGLRSPRWSPNGRYIAAVSSQSPALAVFDLKTQKWTSLGAGGNVAQPAFSSDSRYIYYLSFDSDSRRNGLYRIRVTGGNSELVADLTAWDLSSLWGFSMSLDPSDTALVTREIGTSDIYSMQITLR